MSEGYDGYKAEAESMEEKKSGGRRSEESDESIRHQQNDNGTEFWGYVDVRRGAHMFYWLYLTSHAAGFERRPLIIWLQVRLGPVSK